MNQSKKEGRNQTNEDIIPINLTNKKSRKRKKRGGEIANIIDHLNYCTVPVPNK